MTKIWRGPDYMQAEHARELARRIKTYWRKQGYDVDVRADACESKVGMIYCVRSDMVNGLPRRVAPVLRAAQ
jgi:hypothetical protein